MNNSYIPYLKIPELLNLKSEDTLLICSDITKLAITTIRTEKKFDPSEFILTFKKHMNTGTILFPAFINEYKKNSIFDIKRSIPQTGSLSLSAFHHPDFIRTNDPFHSFMVSGKHSDKLSQLKNTSTFGSDSVFAFLHKMKGKMLLIDIDLQHSFTFAHYVEEFEKVKYRKFKKHTIDCILSNGLKETRTVYFFKKRKGVMLNINGLYKLFKEKGILTEYRINNSLFTIIDLDKSFEIIQQDIQINHAKNLHKFSYKKWIIEFIKIFYLQ